MHRHFIAKRSSQNMLLYFNINYSCNSRCIFCASAGVKSGGTNDAIDANRFKLIFNTFLDYKNKTVVINGGEPTLNKDLIKILKFTKKNGIYCVLFTNGRRLSNYDYAVSVMKSLNGVVTIPLYGYNAKKHDYFTGTKGSFRQTIDGISNVIKVRRCYNLPVLLELKLLFIKPLLRENINIAKFIFDTFPEADIVSLNSLICSAPVKNNFDLIPNAEDLRRSANSLLTSIRKDCTFNQKKISLSDFPRCLINEENMCYLYTQPSVELYFDPYDYEVQKVDRSSQNRSVCSICSLNIGTKKNILTSVCPFGRTN